MPVDRIVAESADQRLLDQTARGAAAGAVLERDELFGRGDHIEGLHSCGTPPYWCQILQVPSLLTMQAPTGESGTHCFPNSGQSLGAAIPAMMSPQMQSAVRAGG